MSSANLGVFGWIREGVKRSVLLGFSDAVEQLGVPSESQELHPQLAAILKPSAASHQPRRPASIAHSPSKPQQRKRLGRSLEQIRDTNAKPSASSVS